jgi:hypothetical protein
MSLRGATNRLPLAGTTGNSLALTRYQRTLNVFQRHNQSKHHIWSKTLANRRFGKCKELLHTYLARYRNDVRCARRAERILHALGNARIVAEQDAGEERRLWFRENLRDDILGV